ncbi:MAG: hypothetical protein HY855_03080, partial [Burkholderiales bacterium]|nr:hypothetical protein [Burkholderiales bacterium]
APRPGAASNPGPALAAAAGPAGVAGAGASAAAGPDLAGAVLVQQFKDRLMRLLPGIGPDGHASAELEALLVALEQSALTPGARQALLWEAVLGAGNEAARRLLYDMIERVGSDAIAARIVEHFDAVAGDAERARLLSLRARGLELRPGELDDPARRARLEHNTGLLADLLGRQVAAGGGPSSMVLRTALDLLPDIAPPELALHLLGQARRQGLLDAAPYYDALVRIVFSEAGLIDQQGVPLLRSLAAEPAALRDAVNGKLFAFVAASAAELGASRPAVADYLRAEEAALLANPGARALGEWLPLHHELLVARAALDGHKPGLADATRDDAVARATVVNVDPSALAALGPRQLEQLRQDFAAALQAPRVGAVLRQSLREALLAVEERLSPRGKG